jgi:carbamoyl-phosphate synthase large subunit
MKTRLLVTGAGTGPSNNLVRSLKAGAPSLVVVGCHADRFYLTKSSADRNYLVPPTAQADFAEALRRIIRAERIDLVIPTGDVDVRRLSALRGQIPCRLLLPRHAVITRCQDKYALAAFLRARGVRAPLTYRVTDLESIGALFRRFAPSSRLWCRIRKGNGAQGATPVTSPAQARSWIRYWRDVRGVPAASFTLSEYLPGRDYSCQSLWHKGTLILVKTFENLSAFAGGAQPSGVSSVAALAKTVRAPRVAELCTRAIRSLDARASGIFCFDVREDASGEPCLTEINAGRFSMSTNLYDFTGTHNMATTYVRVALGKAVEVRDQYDVAEGYYMVRDTDTVPDVVHADALFHGIRDVRAG